MEELNVSQVLHDTRTAYLRNVDATGKTVVSVGANGTWYFDWIHQNCGMPTRHIGVEYYFPKPDDLPPNSEWVANTAGDMSGIDSDTADIVFSGQNIEHLWEEDVTNFLVESNRILKPGGVLIVDSPNRIITEALCIIHPEHMVELTPDEMVEILAAAGFDVILKRGIFLTRDPRNGQFLPYQPDSLLAGAWSLVERCALADRYVDDSYIWWIEARKSDRAPDKGRVRELVRRCWATGWPERMLRLNSALSPIHSDGTRSYYSSAIGQQGALIYGPYAPILKGTYRAAMSVSLLDPTDPDQLVGIMDVLLSEKVVAQRNILARDLAHGEYRDVSLIFSTELETSFGMQCRIISNGKAALGAERDFRLETAERPIDSEPSSLSGPRRLAGWLQQSIAKARARA